MDNRTSNTFRMKSNALVTKIGGILLVGLLSLVTNEIQFDTLAFKYFEDDTVSVVQPVEIKVESPRNPNRATTGSGSVGRRPRSIYTTKSVLPYDRNNSHILRMMDEEGSELALSRIQQESFERKRALVPLIFPRARRYQAFLSEWGANIVNDEYAYLHIFKNGGTTIAAQTKRNHVKIQDLQVQRRKWFTVVRDPIEHFLSGWAECGYRDRQRFLRSKDVHKDYNERVGMWLLRVQLFARRQNRWNCGIHSLPQVNMILNSGGIIPRNMEIVGDLKELPAVLKLVGFEYRPNVETGRNATDNDFIQTYFPKRPDLLSTDTMRRLCDFLAIDYYLLDFPLPSACEDMPDTGYTNSPYRPSPPFQLLRADIDPKFRSLNRAEFERKAYKRLSPKKLLRDEEKAS